MGCTVCGSTAMRPLFDVNDFSIVECTVCTHAYVEHMPTEEELDELYSNTADSFLGSGLAGPMADYLGDDDRRFFAFYADRLEAINRIGTETSARILDFGCAQGAFVETLRRKGFQNVVGLDRSDAAIDDGRTRWKIDLRSGSLPEFVAEHEGEFDLVHAANVLEHVPDPRPVLDDFRRLLVPSGTLIVSVPNTRSLQVRIAGTRSPVIDPPHHLQYYGPKSLTRLVTDAGFAVRRVRTEFWMPASDLYLHMKRVPIRLARLIRYAMVLPGLPINALKLGGVIEIVAVSEQHAEGNATPYTRRGV